jgi:phage tail sheath protein FI
MAFLHGVETLEITSGPRPVTVVRSGVIGLVGIAPKGTPNSLIHASSQNDDSQFGSEVPGFSIPQALSAIRAQGAGSVLVVNVFDPATHTTAVAAETLPAVANRKTALAFAPCGSTPPSITHTSGTPVYVENTDYTIDAFGNVTIIAPIATIAEGAILKATYAKLNTAAITSAVIIGTNSGGVRSGFKCFLDAYNTMGFRPKILIAPGYSSVNAVAAQMIVEADYYKGVCLIDAPTGTTVAAAIAARGPAGSLNFFTSSDRAILLTPGNVKAYDKATNSTQNRPYSQFFAGVMAKNDEVNGYWFSPSNKLIKGTLNGAEYAVTAAINDSTTEANQLNAQGICTVFASGSSGLRTWGNRSAAYPAITHPKNFINIRRTSDVVHESIELAMTDFVDQPMTPGVIDAIRGTVQNFINILIGRGAMYQGSEIIFLDGKNPSAQLAAGQAVFTLRHAEPPPAERLSFESFYDVDLVVVVPQS